MAAITEKPPERSDNTQLIVVSSQYAMTWKRKENGKEEANERWRKSASGASAAECLTQKAVEYKLDPRRKERNEKKKLAMRKEHQKLYNECDRKAMAYEASR